MQVNRVSRTRARAHMAHLETHLALGHVAVATSRFNFCNYFAIFRTVNKWIITTTSTGFLLSWQLTNLMIVADFVMCIYCMQKMRQ